MKYLTTAAGLMLATVAHAETPVLTIYTYDSFVAEWGPGPLIEAAFEETCSCDVQFVAAGDGAALLARVQLEGARSDADIVLGLDTNLMAAAKDSGLFAAHGVDIPAYDMPVDWADDTFLPYDWGYFAFVHRAGEPAPDSLQALADSDLSVVIQDPRSSTPGLGLMLWVEAAYGDDAQEFWTALSDNVVTVTPGWWEAYSMFLEGEADLVLSYTTSPAYHLIAEEDAGYAAAVFTEGHYMQIEVAGMLAGSDQPELAQDFMAFIGTDAFQSAIPTTNWMYPVVTPAGGLPEGFDTLVTPESALLIPADQVPMVRDGALEKWRAGLSE